MDFPHRTENVKKRGVGRLAIAMGASLLTALAGVPAQAMSPEIATDCETCQFPTAARINLCTGVYMGNGVLLTAAHCIDNVTEGVSKARFGEDDANDEYEIVIEECVAHPAGEADTNIWGEPSWDGPDIAYCLLEENLEDLGAVQGATPIIPPMIPEGCERDWLAHEVYETGYGATATSVGSGCSIYQEYWGQDCQDGIKRRAAQKIVRQTSYQGSSTKLEMKRDFWGDDDTGLRSGDSGGPVFLKMPDDTYRLVGVNHGTTVGRAYAEAVPPYLHWIEQSSGRDITPYHYFSSGSWHSTGATALLPKYEYEAWWGDWYYTCSAAPKGFSESYTNEPFLPTLECPGWNLPPTDELAVEPDDPYAGGEVQMEYEMMQDFYVSDPEPTDGGSMELYLEGSEVRESDTSSGFFKAETDIFVAPLFFLPTEESEPEPVHDLQPTKEMDTTSSTLFLGSTETETESLSR